MLLESLFCVTRFNNGAILILYCYYVQAKTRITIYVICVMYYVICVDIIKSSNN